MSRIKIYLIFVLSLFSHNTYSSEHPLPIPFGIELGAILDQNIVINEFYFGDKFTVKPPIKNGHFSIYTASIINEKVYSVSAIGVPSDCKITSRLLATHISKLYGDKMFNSSDTYTLETHDFKIIINCELVDSQDHIKIKYIYKSLASAAGL